MKKNLLIFVLLLLMTQLYNAGLLAGDYKKFDEKSPFYVHAADGLALRKSPSSKSKKLALIPFKSKVIALGYLLNDPPAKDSWLFVEYNNKSGWCLGKSLRGDDPFYVKQIKLKTIPGNAAGEKILDFHSSKFLSNKDCIIFLSGRDIYIKEKSKKICKLSSMVQLPKGFDWFADGVLNGNRLIISAASYPESLRLQDLRNSGGGYVRGPKGVGLLVVDLKNKKANLIKSFSVKQKNGASKPYTPSIRSFYPDKDSLLVGEYGSLDEINLAEKKLKFLISDEVMGINRYGILRQDTYIWYIATAGGMSGFSIDRFSPGTKKVESFNLLNLAYINPDSFLFHNNRLLASSNAGLIEIDEKKSTYFHYPTSDDKKKMGVYNLKRINGKLLAVCDEGWLVYDLANKQAHLFRLNDSFPKKAIYEIGFFDGSWYVSNWDSVIRIK